MNNNVNPNESIAINVNNNVYTSILENFTFY